MELRSVALTLKIVGSAMKSFSSRLLIAILTEAGRDGLMVMGSLVDFLSFLSLLSLLRFSLLSLLRFGLLSYFLIVRVKGLMAREVFGLLI